MKYMESKIKMAALALLIILSTIVTVNSEPRKRFQAAMHKDKLFHHENGKNKQFHDQNHKTFILSPKTLASPSYAHRQAEYFPFWPGKPFPHRPCTCPKIRHGRRYNSEQRHLTRKEIDLINVALNVQYLQADFFLHAASGYGLDRIHSELAGGGPPPIGTHRANLTQLIKHLSKELGLQSTGHIRYAKLREPAIRGKLQKHAVPRPQINLSKTMWTELFNMAFSKHPFVVPFDPYANSVNFLIAAYMLPYVGLTGLVDSSHLLVSKEAKKLVAGLLGVQAAQDAIIRTMLYQMMSMKVNPYNTTVAQFTSKISSFRLKLAHGQFSSPDEGIKVPVPLGAEGQTRGNMVSADIDSLSAAATPEQILRVLYGSGNASKPGAFFPNGANGRISQQYLTHLKT